MSRRQSEEARVLQYFQTAPLDFAERMVGMVREEVKRRKNAALTQPGVLEVTKARPVVRRKSRRAKGGNGVVRVGSTEFGSSDLTNHVQLTLPIA